MTDKTTTAVARSMARKVAPDLTVAQTYVLAADAIETLKAAGWIDLPAAKQQGWQLVPENVTVEMEKAWHRALADHPAFWTAYRAMLAAAPSFEEARNEREDER